MSVRGRDGHGEGGGEKTGGTGGKDMMMVQSKGKGEAGAMAVHDSHVVGRV